MSLEIITRKLSTVLNAHSGAILMGDLRGQMASDLLKSLTEVIERKADNKRPYFILVHSKIDPSVMGGHVIKERIILLDEVPRTKYLGTLLFKIDNKNADATMKWCLPLDIPTLSILGTESGRRGTLKAGEVGIMESARGLPINRRLN